VAVAHALLRMVYHVLADGTVYRGAGADGSVPIDGEIAAALFR
jgi:hypothetical protein